MGLLRGAAFLKRLQIELPVWVQRGWVAENHRQAILDHVSEQAGNSPRYFILILCTMGALLFGAGVITFFAANWGLIPKAAKLAILFAMLGSCYGAAGACFARGSEALAQGLLLLGVIFFGANIFLIAQIYHIDAHYPDGVLIWTLGALVTAALASSQLVLAAALALMLIWSGFETVEFNHGLFWPFFLPWFAALALIFRHRWFTAWRMALWTLFAWCAVFMLAPTFMDRDWIAGERTALWQLYLFSGIALYIVARGMQWYPRLEPFAPALVTVGAMLAVVALFILSFPDTHGFGAREMFTAVLPAAWIGVTAAMLALIGALMVWRYQDTSLATLPFYRKGAFIWLVIAGAIAVVNLWMVGRHPGWIALGYNLLAFVGVVWMVLTGVERAERYLVNLGFAFFSVLLLARYFDTFWALLGRSYFFMAGGALLLGAGFFLERSRRRFTARINDATGAS